MDNLDIFENACKYFLEKMTEFKEIARYEFLARSSIGDEIRCTIYLANEWNILQIGLLGFIAPRYKKNDY